MNKISIWNQQINNGVNWVWRKLRAVQDQNGRRKLYNVFWAVIFGLILAGIFISFSGSNPLLVYQAFFAAVDVNSNKYLLITAIYIFSGIAVGIGFQAGLFNIGVPGQMMLGGAFATMYLHQFANEQNSFPVDTGILFVSFLIASLSGFGIALLAGILKAYFKVNEVVSTILFNWIVFELCRFIFRLDGGFNFPGFAFRSYAHVLPNFYETLNYFLLLFFIAVGFAFIIWWIVRKTTLGYAIKMTGLSATAAQYSGVDNRKLTVLVMGFSGFLAGLCGFLYFVILNKDFNIAGLNGPLNLGFDSIAITMLALNSPVGIIFSGLFYAAFNVGSEGLGIYVGNPNLNINTYTIIVGIVIYLVAMAAVFSQFNPLIWIQTKFLLLRNSQIYWTRDQQQQFQKRLHHFQTELKQQPDQAKKIQFISTFLNQLEQEWTKQSVLNLSFYRQLQKIHWQQFWLEWRHYSRLLKQNHKAIVQLKKQAQANWNYYLSLESDQAQIAFLDQIQNAKSQVQTQLTQLHYYKKKQLISNFWAWYREKKQLTKKVRTQAREVMGRYYWLLFYRQFYPKIYAQKLSQFLELQPQRFLTTQQYTQLMTDQTQQLKE
ncbi:ABC-type uncharacterized transport system permease subunit [Mycoplasmoides fastidiosum]|uniref:ABC-type uncharacterized transport system permease subunit n=1 Tax=Mycoplasmoides fastidiosum TaxID=92758 RepID=A0ABU0M031_9BACT|nr:hypothetical protein [Mycoplasmoides fastidiosum]MDQ0514310.1 ABC-type uncharacterized transport system permease subunit [Mycoplasmoides fastidiosum]UUD38086.1 hypothetical protein NPA10_01685 [Mycoplasmoides fastidiosum]